MEDELTDIFDLFGLSAAEATHYRQLRERGAMPSTRDSASATLIGIGLAEDRGGTLVPTSLRLAVEHRAVAMHERFETARRAAIEADSRSARPAGSVTETIYGVDAVNRAFLDLQRNAHATVRSFDRGPYFSTGGVPQLSSVQAEASARGVDYLTIVEQQAVESAESRATVREGVELGESVRVIANLPLRLSIADDRVALLVLPRASGSDGRDPDDVDVLVVYPSAFLDGLINMFAGYWDLALPLDLGAGERSPDVDSRHFVRLLAAGMTDAAIARELGVSARTVQRRLNLLQQRLGASSRFQLGVQAVRAGLLDIASDA